jgi:farnesyl diphosphate synthase
MGTAPEGQALLGPALAAIQAEVDACFDALLPMTADPRDRLVEAMRYAAIGGGKRLRPLLVGATAAMFGVDRTSAVRVGTALEAIHVYSLIHDDLPCMDDDALRHGKPTVHKAFDEATLLRAAHAVETAADFKAKPNKWWTA